MNGATSQTLSTMDNRKAPDIRSALGRQDTEKDKATQPGDTREKISQRGVIVKDKHIGSGDVVEDGKRVVCDFMIRLLDGTQVLQNLSSTPVCTFS
jgi:FKBP-type peptidyl-prolyl cis-trans isomerase